MKYLPLATFDAVTNALNFSTADCHVIGGCDVYTTKAAGGDKKLYKQIDNRLESQYESLVRLSASLSPPYQATAASDDGKGGGEQEGRTRSQKRGNSVGLSGVANIDLSRNSPFGPLSQISARRTFAYLIATLNASHPDYDFSHALRPSDFRKERSLTAIMHHIDSTLQNLRPRARKTYLAPPAGLFTSNSNNKKNSIPAVVPAVNSSGSEIWSGHMWQLIDAEMGLADCEKYVYAPDEGPFDGEEGAIWSIHYFFFSKERKRVCYLHLRGLSVLSHSPVHAAAALDKKKHSRPALVERKASSVSSVSAGAGKRASYWLGARSGGVEDMDGYGNDDDDDDDEMVVEEKRADDYDEEDEVEVPYMDLDDIRGGLADGGYYAYEREVYGDGEMDDGDVGYLDYANDGWRPVRTLSEEVGEMMEV